MLLQALHQPSAATRLLGNTEQVPASALTEVYSEQLAQLAPGSAPLARWASLTYLLACAAGSCSCSIGSWSGAPAARVGGEPVTTARPMPVASPVRSLRRAGS